MEITKNLSWKDMLTKILFSPEAMTDLGQFNYPAILCSYCRSLPKQSYRVHYSQRKSPT